MNTFQTAVASDLVQQLGWTLLHSLWQVSVIAVVLAIVLQLIPCQRSNWRYTATCLALLAVCVFSLGTYAFMNPSGAPTASSDANSSEVAVVDSVPNGIRHTRPVAPTAELQEGNLQTEHNPVFDGESADAANAVSSASSIAGMNHGDVMDVVMPWLVVAWFVGAVCIAIWHLGGLLILRRLCRRASKPAEAIVKLVHDCGDRLEVRRTVRVLCSKTVSSPAVVGIWEPVILLPAALASGLSTHELRAILLHELAHIRRHDFLINVMQAVVESLFFYHPAVWWISHRIRTERENCCDDLACDVLGNRFDYTRALTSVSEFASTQTSTGALVAASGANLEERINRLLLPPRCLSAVASSALVALLLLLTV